MNRQSTNHSSKRFQPSNRDSLSHTTYIRDILLVWIFSSQSVSVFLLILFWGILLSFNFLFKVFFSGYLLTLIDKKYVVKWISIYFRNDNKRENFFFFLPLKIRNLPHCVAMNWIEIELYWNLETLDRQNRTEQIFNQPTDWWRVTLEVKPSV